MNTSRRGFHNLGANTEKIQTSDNPNPRQQHLNKILTGEQAHVKEKTSFSGGLGLSTWEQPMDSQIGRPTPHGESS